MRYWEYLIYNEKNHVSDFYGVMDQNRLNKLGEEGWELVTIMWHENAQRHKIYTFKREHPGVEYDAGA
jgi:hypothetical protein